MNDRRMSRAAIATALTGAVLVPLSAAAPAAAAPAPTVSCTSAKPGLATKLSKDITTALRGRRSLTAISLHDRTTKTTCTLRATQKFDSASVVKTTVLATLLWDAKKTNRYLTARENKLATAMITKSDNDSTSALWAQLGPTKIKKFLTAAKMTNTVPGAGRYWGLTQITARDEQKLLDLLTVKNTVLSDNSRAYILDLMRKVISSQRWGTPAGAPSSARIQVKNGWLPRSTHGWRVHSMGAFTGGRHNYAMTVLTHDNPAMQDGVNTIQAVSRAIHKALNPTAAASTLYAPTRTPREAIPAVPKA
ncbi:MAG TPA: serine hydrolase [Streptomyces sp.]|nr:serine hydrolase [Streptomyces sp.]